MEEESHLPIEMKNMEIIKDNDKINLYNNEELVETYTFSSDIDFKQLINFLISKNLQEKYTIDKEFDDKTPEEEGLISLIKDILSDYNKKVDDYETFLKNEQKKDNK